MAEETKDAVITYETLYEVLRLEKYRAELQKLDNSFFEKVIRYLDEKRALLQSSETKDSVFTSQTVQKTRKQIENIQKLIQELYEKRESKIIQMALYASRMDTKPAEISALLKEEKDMFNDLVEWLNVYRAGVMYNLLNAKKPKIIKPKGIKMAEEPQDNIKLVKFMQAVPQFIGDDMNVYGPFEAEDIASLPVMVAEILAKNGKIEEMKS